MGIFGFAHLKPGVKAIDPVAKAINIAKEESPKNPVKDREPALLSGFWSNNKKEKLHTKSAANQLKCGDSAYAYIETIGVPDKTNVKITIKEYDPTFFDGDEIILTTNAQVMSNCIHRKFTIDKAWHSNESDQLSEVYFEVEGMVTINKKEYNLKKTYPANTDDYLYIVDNGILITVIIKLPHSQSTDKWEGKGLGGHTGIAIGQEFYDFGPDVNQYATGGSPITGVAGIPWWDQQILDGSGGRLTRLSDVDLPDILSYINANIKQNVYKVEFTVTTEQAKMIEKWWLDRYKNLGVYACLPWSGEQCITTVRISLEKAGVIPASNVQTPDGFLKHMKLFSTNTAGPNKYKAAKVTQIQWE